MLDNLLLDLAMLGKLLSDLDMLDKVLLDLAMLVSKDKPLLATKDISTKNPFILPIVSVQKAHFL